jgi:hypothetical protein
MISQLERQQIIKFAQSFIKDVHSPVGTAGLYAILQYVFPKNPLFVSEGKISGMKNLSLEEFFHKYHFEDIFVPEKSISHIVIALGKLFDILNDCGLLHNPIAFFNTFYPNIVMNQVAFHELPEDRRYITLYLVLLRGSTYYTSSTPPSFDDYQRLYKDDESLLSELEIDFGEYIRLWDAVLYVKAAETPKAASVRINDAKKYFRDGKINYGWLLNDYLRVLTLQIKGNIPPYLAHHTDRIRIMYEQGITKLDELIAESVSNLKYESPTNVIFHLYYATHTGDTNFECSFLMDEFLSEAADSSRVLIVNPNPLFIKTLRYTNPTMFAKLKFAVTDRTVRDLYALEFSNISPYYQLFYSFDELKNYTESFDFVLLTAGNHPFSDLDVFLPLCAPNCRFIGYLPQNYLTSDKYNFTTALKAYNFQPDKIISTPKSTKSGSKSKKKMLLYGRINATKTVETMSLLSLQLTDDTSFFYMDRQYFQVPTEYIHNHKTIIQIRNAAKNAIAAKEALTVSGKRARTAPLYVNFSPEILISLNIFGDSTSGYYAQASYRAIIQKGDKRTHGKMLTPPTEKGLRGKSKSEVMALARETVALQDNQIQPIVNDILSNNKGNLNSVSLKTLWLCCHNALRTYLSYTPEIGIELFCGNDQTLSNLIVEETNESIIETAASKVLNTDSELPSKYWLYLDLIFKTALQHRWISSNPIVNVATIVKNETKNSVSTIRSNIGKRCFTDEEEMRIFSFLTQDVGGHNTPRCIAEGIYLLPLIRLLTGIPIREILALQWKHFRQISNLNAYQFWVVAYINRSGQLVSLENYRNNRRRRKISQPPILSQLLCKRMEYLCHLYRCQPEAIDNLPIIPPKELKRLPRKQSFCSVDAAYQVSKEALNQAQISQNILTLLEGEKQFDIDLNDYSGDLFRSHYSIMAKQVCQLTTGERCYLSGSIAPDTYSAHYADYGNDFLQYDITWRLHRWTNKFSACFNECPDSQKLSAFIGSINFEHQKGIVDVCSDFGCFGTYTITRKE